MKKYSKKLVILFMILLVALSLFGCKKKKKSIFATGHEVGGTPAPKVEHFGVQTSRGTESNPIHVYVATIYVPKGRDEKGQSQYEQILYEMEELTPENLNTALIDCGVLSEDALFVDFNIIEARAPQEMGPGAVGQKKDKDGEVRYVELLSDLENSDDYRDKDGSYFKDVKKLKGLIDFDDILGAVMMTFEENYQLAECGFIPANMQDYNEAQSKK